MKNYYVMDRNSQMVYRDTLKGCQEWCRKQRLAFEWNGMKPPVYRIFYDGHSEPVETI